MFFGRRVLCLFFLFVWSAQNSTHFKGSSVSFYCSFIFVRISIFEATYFKNGHMDNPIFDLHVLTKLGVAGIIINLLK